MKNFLLLTLALMLMTGCEFGSDDFGRELVEIDSLLEADKLTMAEKRLEAIKPWQLNEKDRAYYDLLRVESKWKLYIPVESDTLLNSCQAYFESGKYKEKLARAYYYKGVILEERGRSNEAVEYLKRAEVLADDVGGLTLRNKVYMSLGILNSDAGNKPQALVYAKKTLECSRKMNRGKDLFFDLGNLSVAYNRMGMRDSAKLYMEESLRYKNDVDKADYARALADLGIFYENDNQVKAESLVCKSIKIHPFGFAYNSLARIYANRGDHQQSERMLKKGLESATTVRERINSLKGLYELRVNAGQYKEANELMERVRAMKDSLAEKQKKEDVGVQQVVFDKQVERQNAHAENAHAWAAVLLLVLFLMLFAVYHAWQARKKRKRLDGHLMIIEEGDKKIEAANHEIEELRTMGMEQAKELKKMQRQMDKMQRKQQQAIRKTMREQEELLARGRLLYASLMDGGKTATWKKGDFVAFDAYYGIVDPAFMDSLDGIENSPTANNYRLYLELRHQGWDSGRIKSAMCLSEGAWRTMRSRIREMEELLC